MALTLSWGSIIIIVIIIVRAIICISFICLLGFMWVLSLFLRFSFRFTSTSGLFWFCAFKWLGYFTLFFVTECTMSEYNPSTVAPVAINGIAGVGGSHFYIMCLRDFALSFTSDHLCI